MANTVPSMPSRFSLKLALQDSVGHVFNNFFAFVRFAWVNFAVLALIVVLTVYLAVLTAPVGPLSVLIAGIGTIAGALMLLSHIIIVTRNYVLGEQDPAVRPVFVPVFLRGILLFLILTAAAIICCLVIGLILVAGFGMRDAAYFEKNPLISLAILGIILLAFLPVFYIWARLNTWVPSIAADRSQTLSAAWSATKGAGIRIFLGTILLTFVFGFVNWGVGDGVASLLSVNKASFNAMLSPKQLPSLLIWALVELGIFFMAVTASALFSASIFKQTQTT